MTNGVIHLPTQHRQRTFPTPLNHDGRLIESPTLSDYAAAGWRIVPEVPPVAEGYRRVAETLVDDDGVNGKWEVTDRLIAEVDAEAAAGRKAAMAAQLTPGLVALAAAYRTALRAIGGPGAEVNRKVTQAAVVGAMLALPPEQYDAKTADMLKLAFEEICKVTGTGETWTFFETVGDLIPEVTP